ncbi:hypothetical protein Tco_1161991, partial [Tanacetum coccineum]
QPQPSADPTPSQSVPTTSSSHVQITQSPPTLTHSVQPPPQSSTTTPPTQPVQTTSSPPVSTIPDIQPTLPPSPQIPSPSYHDTEGPSFEPSYHMSPPPSHEPEIQKMNKKDADKEEEKKDESVHEEVQEEEGAKKRKLGTRRKLKAKRRKHGSSLTREDDDLKICLHIAPDEDKVIDAESLDQLISIMKQSFFLTTKPQYDPTKPNEDIYLNKVTRSNGHQRFFRTLMGVLSILDREDLKVIYELVMEEYKDTLPEGFEKMLWEI